MAKCPYGDNYIEARQKCPHVKLMNEDMAESAKEYAAEIARLTAQIKDVEEHEVQLSHLKDLQVQERDAEIARLNAIIDSVRIQAQGWAQEARTQRGIVCKIYEIVSGKTGEPGDWNGEVPVRDEIARLNAEHEHVLALLAEHHGGLPDSDVLCNVKHIIEDNALLTKLTRILAWQSAYSRDMDADEIACWADAHIETASNIPLDDPLYDDMKSYVEQEDTQ